MSDTNYRPVAGQTNAGQTKLDGLKSTLLNVFGRGVDALEANIGKAPPNLQPAARKAVEVARARPLLTMAGLAVGAMMLSRRSRRR